MPSDILCKVFSRLSAVRKDSAKLIRLGEMITDTKLL